MTHRPRLHLPDGRRIEGEPCPSFAVAEAVLRRLAEEWWWAESAEIVTEVSLPTTRAWPHVEADTAYGSIPPPRPNPRALRGNRPTRWAPSPGLPG